MARSRRNSSHRAAGGTTTVATDDLRPIGADGSRPPRLKTRLVQRLRILALANALPVLFGVVLAWLWVSEQITFEIDEHRLALTVAVIIAAVVVVLLAWWVLLPVSVWLRAYPLWYYRHESRLVWALPLALGYLAWFTIWILAIGLTLTGGFLVVSGLWNLLSRALAVA